MYLKIKNNKLKVVELTKFWERFKNLKFVFEPLDYVIKFPHKKYITTNFLCQRIDIISTDKDDKILYIYQDVPTEKRILPKRKVYNIYFLPKGFSKNFQIGEKLKFTKK